MHTGLIVYIPAWIYFKSRRNQKEIDPEIPRELIVYICSQISSKRLRKQTRRSIDDLLSIVLRYLFMLKEIDHDIRRGLIVHIPFQISIKSSRKQKEIEPEIHRGLIVYIPSRMSLKSLRKQTKRFTDDLWSIFLSRSLLKA